jgi:branched-chain amino acid transport system ATP-binding protein
MLEISDLHAHYGLSHVLQGMTFSVGAGEVIGLFGRNGVGKTTTLRTIAGWLKPTSGSVRLAGCDLGTLTADAICRRGVGFVPEDRRVFPGLTVDENMRLGLLQCPGRGRAASAAAMEKVYERFPRLQQRMRQMGTTLSGGEQQMLAIARVLVGAPKLLLIDEPTEGLAPQIVDEIFAIMLELKQDGQTIVLVEQNVRRALGIADQIVAIERGRVVFAGHAANVTDREELLRRVAV